MKTLAEHIIESIEPCNEGRSNPESITTSIKKWIMEFSQSPYECFDYSLDFVKAIHLGIKRGIHEFEKKAPNDKPQVQDALELLKDVESVLAKYENYQIK